jgi:transcription factor C subunit 7
MPSLISISPRRRTQRYLGVAEWYSPVGPGTGLHPRPDSAESLRKYFPDISTDWSTVYYPPRKGELVEEVHVRAATALATVMSTAQKRLPPQAVKRILVVSHAATVIALARALAKDRALPMRAGCCSLTKFVKWTDGGEGWQLVLSADGGHLTGGSTRDWGFEDIEIEHGQVVHDDGEPGTEDEVDEPVGLQVQITANL